MSDVSLLSRLARRSFLSRLGVGTAALAAIGVPTASASAAAPAATDWQPAHHTEDDWYDQPGAKHRLFIDTTEPDTFGQAIAWSRNFLEASNSSYGLTDADSALIICARHDSTPFAFTDAMWAKHGAIFAERSHFVDPKTKQAPTLNVYLASGYGEQLRNTGNTLDSMLKRGVRLAVCGLATRRLAGLIAKKQGTSADEAFKELSANLVSNAHIVAAGIVAVNRAQERGYTTASVL
jgi:intracellular sulfur oxidation DsrE/DsrF family protein